MKKRKTATEEARKHATSVKDDFVAIKKHHEILNPAACGICLKNPEKEWELDHEAGGIELVD